MTTAAHPGERLHACRVVVKHDDSGAGDGNTAAFKDVEEQSRRLAAALEKVPGATVLRTEANYDFVELRPVSRVVPPRDRILIWPQAEFWVVREVAVGAQGEPSGEGETSAPSIIFTLRRPDGQ